MVEIYTEPHLMEEIERHIDGRICAAGEIGIICQQVLGPMVIDREVFVAIATKGVAVQAFKTE